MGFAGGRGLITGAGATWRGGQTRFRKWPKPPIPTTWNLGVSGTSPLPHPRPRREGRLSCALAGPSRPPSHGHRVPKLPLDRPSVLQGPPPPRLRGSPRSRPRGSIGWRRSASARGPPPPPLALAGRGLQAASSRFRAKPDSAPGQRGRRGRTGPSDRARPAAPGRGREGERARPPPRPATPTPPPPLPSPAAEHPAGARGTPAAPRDPEGARGGGRAAVALRPPTTAGSAGGFSSRSGLPPPLSVERKEASCPVCGLRWAGGATGAPESHTQGGRRAPAGSPWANEPQTETTPHAEAV